MEFLRGMTSWGASQIRRRRLETLGAGCNALRVLERLVLPVQVNQETNNVYKILTFLKILGHGLGAIRKQIKILDSPKLVFLGLQVSQKCKVITSLNF